MIERLGRAQPVRCAERLALFCIALHRMSLALVLALGAGDTDERGVAFATENTHETLAALQISPRAIAAGKRKAQAMSCSLAQRRVGSHT